MILVIDNYDSFTYNVVYYLKVLGEKVVVKRNDKCDADYVGNEISKKKIDKIVVSPGPSHPSNSGNCNEIIKEFLGKVPTLGICLGHQCLGFAHGGVVEVAKKIYHGMPSTITHENKGIFKGLKNPFLAIRYNSLVIKKGTLAKEFEVVAKSDDDEIMAIQHREFPAYGVQFHPESIGSEEGMQLLKNFINIKTHK